MHDKNPHQLLHQQLMSFAQEAQGNSPIQRNRATTRTHLANTYLHLSNALHAAHQGNAQTTQTEILQAEHHQAHLDETKHRFFLGRHHSDLLAIPQHIAHIQTILQNNLTQTQDTHTLQLGPHTVTYTQPSPPQNFPEGKDQWPETLEGDGQDRSTDPALAPDSLLLPTENYADSEEPVDAPYTTDKGYQRTLKSRLKTMERAHQHLRDIATLLKAGRTPQKALTELKRRVTNLRIQALIRSGRPEYNECRQVYETYLGYYQQARNAIRLKKPDLVPVPPSVDAQPDMGKL